MVVFSSEGCGTSTAMSSRTLLSDHVVNEIVFFPRVIHVIVLVSKVRRWCIDDCCVNVNFESDLQVLTRSAFHVFVYKVNRVQLHVHSVCSVSVTAEKQIPAAMRPTL